MSATAAFTSSTVASAPKKATYSKKDKDTTSQSILKERELCGICANTYTPILRRKITCKFCSKDVCTKCIEQYLLSRVEDAHCIYCRVNYSYNVLREICTQTFLQQTYFRHRQEILINRERANLPALQTAAYREKQARDKYKKERDILAEINELKLIKNKLLVQYSQLYTSIDNKLDQDDIVDRMRGIIEQRNDIKLLITKKKKEIQDIYHNRMIEIQGEEEDENDKKDDEKKNEKKKFIRRCMKAGCQGFLSTAWKCGICENYSCAKCFTVKGLNHDTPHVCSKDDLETAELIRADSKPCPNCGEFINKSSGCFAKDTVIPLWNGSTKMAQDISEGDILIGDDEQPRIVLGTICGVEELYTITQTNGMTYTVNGSHTLVLRHRVLNKWDSILEITVEQYLKLSDNIHSSLAGYRIQNQDTHLSTLRIKSIGLGEFYGWKVDKNSRFLLSDKTVVKNCSQMFCITCRTPWDWNTGKIVTHGVIHNPHYYEWIKRNGSEIPRNPADIPCGGYPMQWELRNITLNTSRRAAQYFLEFHRICMEIQDHTGTNYRSHIDQNVLHDMHIRFLLGDFDEKEWGKRLAMAEKKRKCDSEIQEVFAAFRMVAVEMINRIQHYRDESVDAFTLLTHDKANAYLEEWNVEVQELITMVNDGLRAISSSYLCRVPLIFIMKLNDSQGFTHSTRYSLGNYKYSKNKRTDLTNVSDHDQSVNAQDKKDKQEQKQEEKEEQKSDDTEFINYRLIRIALGRSLFEK